MKRADGAGRAELPEKCVRLAIRPTACAIAALLALTIDSNAWAQVSISGGSSVVVDLGVLEQLGPAPTVPGLQLLAPTEPRSLSDPPATALVSRLNPEIARRLGIVAEPATRRPAAPAIAPPAAPTPVAAPASPPAEPAPPRAPVIAAPATPVPPPPTLTEVPAAMPPSETPPAEPGLAATPVEKPVSRVAGTEAEEPATPAVPEPPAEPVAVAVASPPADPATPAPAEEPKPQAAAPDLPSQAEPRESTAAATPDAPSPTVEAPEVTAEPAQVASVPPQEPDGDGVFRVGFDPGSAKLTDDIKSPLEQLAQRLSADEALRVQLRAFAAGTPETSSQARRLSLSRALAVRAFLIDKGVRSTRMDVRALGSNNGGDEPDRVDIVLVRP